MASLPNNSIGISHGITLIPVNEDGLRTVESILGREFTISKNGIYNLHKQLRHSNDVKNCDTGGFFLVDYILSTYKTTIDKLMNSVFHNNKNRFELAIRDNALYVRACQGHSGKILEKIVPEHIYNVYMSDEDVFHRTTPEVKELIFSPDESTNGLRPINRQVHMALTEDLARKDDKFPEKININVTKARDMGIVLYQASNGVVLSYDKIPVSCLYV
jgi:RNA:NAD 2'-phosphotransferase (TPT1/KptA family)